MVDGECVGGRRGQGDGESEDVEGCEGGGVEDQTAAGDEVEVIFF